MDTAQTYDVVLPCTLFACLVTLHMLGLWKRDLCKRVFGTSGECMAMHIQRLVASGSVWRYGIWKTSRKWSVLRACLVPGPRGTASETPSYPLEVLYMSQHIDHGLVTSCKHGEIMSFIQISNLRSLSF